VKAYAAIVEHTGRGWNVAVEDVDGWAAVQVRDLADVEPQIRKHIASVTGTDPAAIDLEVDVRLPPAIQLHLDLIASLCNDVDDEVDQVLAAMRELGLSRGDIGRVIALRYQPPRPLMISNHELADHGLDAHPLATGVEWDDHGFALTRTCRRHIDSTRGLYRQLVPEGLNAIVYPGAEKFVCDFCHEGDDSPGPDNA
jgi:hypothetical protein